MQIICNGCGEALLNLGTFLDTLSENPPSQIPDNKEELEKQKLLKNLTSLVSKLLSPETIETLEFPLSTSTFLSDPNIYPDPQHVSLDAMRTLMVLHNNFQKALIENDPKKISACALTLLQNICINCAPNDAKILFSFIQEEPNKNTTQLLIKEL